MHNCHSNKKNPLDFFIYDYWTFFYKFAEKKMTVDFVRADSFSKSMNNDSFLDLIRSKPYQPVVILSFPFEENIHN